MNSALEPSDRQRFEPADRQRLEPIDRQRLKQPERDRGKYDILKRSLLSLNVSEECKKVL